LYSSAAAALPPKGEATAGPASQGQYTKGIAVQIYLDHSLDSYRTFLRIKSLPRYEIHGRLAVVPDEYAATLGIDATSTADVPYEPSPWLFDYQLPRQERERPIHMDGCH